jgi:hypothetical protein
MAPGIIETQTQTETQIPTKTLKVQKPLQLSGALDQYESFDVTPVIGTEFPTLKIVDLINAPNADELLRDLAIKSEHFCHNLSARLVLYIS